MIETARLRLRQGTEADILGLVAALNDWDVAQWLSRPPFPYSEDDARAFLRWSQPRAEAAPPTGYVVADLRTDRLFGVASLEPQGESAELGYWLARSVQGHGLMKEAAAAILEEGRKRAVRVRTVYATTDPENHRSQAVLLECGFRKVAEEPRETPTRRGCSMVFRFERGLAAPAISPR